MLAYRNTLDKVLSSLFKSGWGLLVAMAVRMTRCWTISDYSIHGTGVHVVSVSE